MFGQQQASTAPSLFGQSGIGTAQATPFGGGTSQATPFGGGTAQSTAFGGGGLFGTQSTAPSLFGGSAFGTTATNAFGGTATSGGFGGFGSTAGGLFGTKPAQPGPTQQAPQNKNQQVMASVYSINVFNDERDDILKKWNMLQACWGTGKGYYNSGQPPVEYTPQNPFYRLVCFI